MAIFSNALSTRIKNEFSVLAALHPGHNGIFCYHPIISMLVLKVALKITVLPVSGFLDRLEIRISYTHRF